MVTLGVQAGIKKFGEALAGGIGDFIDILKGLPWGSIGSAFQIMGQGAKIALDAFKSAPPWLQTAVLTGWGLNKLTGGALGKIAVTLGTDVLGSFIKRGGTPATPLFVADVTGGAAKALGGGAPMAAAAGGGALKGLLGFGAKWILGPAAAVLIGAEIAKAVNEQTIGPAQRLRDGPGQQGPARNEHRYPRRRSARPSTAQINGTDVLGKVAQWTSRIPFVGDALSNVASKMDDQRAEFDKAIAAAGRRRSTTRTSRRAARAPASGPRPQRRWRGWA